MYHKNTPIFEMFELHELPLRSVQPGISDFHDQVNFLELSATRIKDTLKACGRLFYGYPIGMSCIEF